MASGHCALPRRSNHSNAKSIDFRPGQLLGSVSGELGLRKFSSRRSYLGRHRRQGRPNSVFEKELVDADIVISQPFWPPT